MSMSKIAALIFLFAFGVFLVFAGITTVSNREWPIFMPPQFDVIGFALGVFGPKGTYVAGVAVLLLGLAICVAAIVATFRGPRA